MRVRRMTDDRTSVSANSKSSPKLAESSRYLAKFGGCFFGPKLPKMQELKISKLFQNIGKLPIFLQIRKF